MSSISSKLQRVNDVTNDFILDLKYFSNDNFTSTIVPGYKANILYLSNAAITQLLKCIEIFNKHNLKIKVFDGYRPQKAVDFFVHWRSEPENKTLKERFHPTYTKEELFLNNFICSPSSHSRGSTIDLTLVDANGQELDMGTEFDFFHSTANTHAPNLPAHVIKNRALLFETMTNNGFKNLPSEWWHYTLKDEPYPNEYFDFDIE